MKKFTTHILALAFSLIFVLASCSGGTTRISSAFSADTVNINNDLATLGIVADSYTNSDPDVVAVALTGSTLELTSKEAGNSTVTLSDSSSADVSFDAGSLIATVAVKVATNGKISYEITRPDGSKSTGGG